VKPSREYLGTDHASFVRRKVFLLVDALETDELLFIRIERTRVYFDDVLAVTYHKERGVLFLVFTGIMALFWGIPAAAGFAKGDDGGHVAGVFLGVLALLFGLAFVLRLTLQVDVISVFGRRTNSRMRFWLRKERAREIYTRLVDQIRARQQKAAASLPPPPAPPDVPVPPSPPAAAPPLPPEAPPAVPS
jgi:hypothetical protein